MNKLYLIPLLMVVVGCDSPVKRSNKKFDIVSSFNQIIDSTDDEQKAYQKAYYLNLMGKNFSSKSCYFVVCNEKNN